MPAFIDLTGKIFGRLTVIKKSIINVRGRPGWDCRCDCGNITTKAAGDLQNGDSKSCGCLRRDLIKKDLTGKKFGRLTALEIVGKKGTATVYFWKCLCDCGNYQDVNGQHLREGSVNHCNKCPNKSDETILQEAKERFFKSFDIKETGCWEWNALRNRQGYGCMYYTRSIIASRFSYMIHKGPLEKYKYICHTCDNPCCVNPDHLYQGTPRDNVQDALKRLRHPCGQKSHYAKLTLDQVKYIVESKEKGVDLAKKFGVDKNTICTIRKRKSWRFSL